MIASRPRFSLSRRITSRTRQLSPNTKAYVALALGAVCIGFSAIFTKWANVAGPVSAFYRVAIATGALAVPFALQMLRRRRRLRNAERRTSNAESADSKRSTLRSPRSVLALTGLAGLFFALDLGFWNSSLLLTSAANSTLLGNTSTLWVSLGALLLFHVSLKRRFWIGMVAALAGAVIVVGRDAFIHPQLSLGDLLALVGSLFYAGYLLTTERTRRRMGTLQFMWLSSAAATLLLLGYVLAGGFQLTGYSANTYEALVALGLISHALGWLSINYALGHLPAPLASVSLLAQPVITALLAVPLLNEGLSIYQVAGGLLVLLGIYVVNRR